MGVSTPYEQDSLSLTAHPIFYTKGRSNDVRLNFLGFCNSYLNGCDNELAKIHTHHPQLCDKVGCIKLRKSEPIGPLVENFTGDIYKAGWISEMYGYSFAASELKFRHVIRNDILFYPGYVPAPGVNYRVLHYGLEFRVGNWSFVKAKWRHMDVVNKCWDHFPDPPDPSRLDRSNEESLQSDLLSIECVKTPNEALLGDYKRKNCHDSNSLATPAQETPPFTTLGEKARNPPTLRSPDHDTTVEVQKVEKIDV